MAGKVAILNQGYIPHYRLRFFELLARQGGAEYVVFHGAPPSWTGVSAVAGPFAFPQRRVRNREIRFGPRTAIYQPVLREILAGGYDAVVLGHELKFISSLLLAVLAPLRGIAVIYWGFGYYPKRGSRHRTTAQRGMAAVNAMKDLLVRMSDGYLAYTQSGAERLAAIGYPRERISVLRNTIDITEQLYLYDKVRDRDPLAIRAELGLRPDSAVFVYLGRLVEFKRVDLLIDAVRRLARDGRTGRPVEALIIGSGPLDTALREAAADVPQVHFLGELPADERIACCLKVAAAVVIPGAVGLAVTHGFAHGRPMITGNNELHGPEVEYILVGENGLIVAGGGEEFAKVLGDLADSPEEQARLAAGALKARDALRIEAMVEQFDAGVRQTIARRRRRGRAPTEIRPGAK